MPVISPQITAMKDWRNKFINMVADLLPQGNLPNPPLGMPVTDPGTWQGAGQRVLDMAIPQPEDTMFGLAKPLFPKILNPLMQEARKYPTYDEFENAFIKDIKHGRYYHVTHDPNFIIDPTKGPMDASSLAGNMTPDVGKLMATSHLENWLPYLPDRNYVAVLDMSNVPNKQFRNTTRGFGNEFFIDDPTSAKVLKVLNKKAALSDSRRYQNALESYVKGPEDLKSLYDEAIKLRNNE